MTTPGLRRGALVAFVLSWLTSPSFAFTNGIARLRFTRTYPVSRSFSTTPQSFDIVSIFNSLFQPRKSKPTPPPEKAELLALIADLESKGGARGSSPVDQAIRLEQLINALSEKNPNPNCVRSSNERQILVSAYAFQSTLELTTTLNKIGNWRLVYTARSNLGLESKEWLQYLLQNGPSPVQRFVIGSVQQASFSARPMTPPSPMASLWRVLPNAPWPAGVGGARVPDVGAGRRGRSVQQLHRLQGLARGRPQPPGSTPRPRRHLHPTSTFRSDSLAHLFTLPPG